MLAETFRLTHQPDLAVTTFLVLVFMPAVYADFLTELVL